MHHARQQRRVPILTLTPPLYNWLGYNTMPGIPVASLLCPAVSTAGFEHKRLGAAAGRGRCTGLAATSCRTDSAADSDSASSRPKQGPLPSSAPSAWKPSTRRSRLLWCWPSSNIAIELRINARANGALPSLLLPGRGPLMPQCAVPWSAAMGVKPPGT